MKVLQTKSACLAKLTDEQLSGSLEDITRNVLAKMKGVPSIKVLTKVVFADGSLNEEDITTEMERRLVVAEEDQIYNTILVRHLRANDELHKDILNKVAESTGQPLEEIHFWDFAKSMIGTIVWVRTLRHRPNNFNLKVIEGLPIIYSNFMPAASFSRGASDELTPTIQA
jgi:hypothetical protein